MCGRSLSGVMNCSHEACIVMSRGVVSLGSFPSSVVAGRSKQVILRVSREVRREVLGAGLSPSGNLAMITLVGWTRTV